MKQKLNEDNKLDEQMGGWRSSITSRRLQLELFYWVSGWLPGRLPCFLSIRDAHGRVSLTLIEFGWWVGLGFVVVVVQQTLATHVQLLLFYVLATKRSTASHAPTRPPITVTSIVHPRHVSNSCYLFCYPNLIKEI